MLSIALVVFILYNILNNWRKPFLGIHRIGFNIIKYVLNKGRSGKMVAKKTPLYDEHVKLGGKIVDYAGWFLPVQYEGLIPEHNAVRNEAGIFDVSHMGVVMVKGKDSLPYLQYLFTNDLSKAEENQVMYTMMCYPDGGVVDDLLVYKFSEEEYLLVVNAANTDKDLKWMIDNKKDFNIIIENISDQMSIMAIQGPNQKKYFNSLQILIYPH